MPASRIYPAYDHQAADERLQRMLAKQAAKVADLFLAKTETYAETEAMERTDPRLGQVIEYLTDRVMNRLHRRLGDNTLPTTDGLAVLDVNLLMHRLAPTTVQYPERRVREMLESALSKRLRLPERPMQLAVEFIGEWTIRHDAEPHLRLTLRRVV